MLSPLTSTKLGSNPKSLVGNAGYFDAADTERSEPRLGAKLAYRVGVQTRNLAEDECAHE